MANEDGSEDRLTKGEFAELIQHLSVQEILTIEYRVGNQWSKLFSKKSVPPYPFFCNLCVLEASSFNNLIAHIDGKKHKIQMERVKQLYHSDYTNSKDFQKGDIKKCLSKIKGDPTPNSIQKHTLNTLNQPQGASEEKIQNVKNKTNNLKLATANVQKKVNDNVKVSEGIKVKTETDKTKTTAASEDKKEEINAEISICKKTQPPNLKVVTQNRNVKPEICDESLKLNSGSKSTEKIHKPTPDKRSLPDNNSGGGVDIKKRKIVLNPAAALALKANTVMAVKSKNDENSSKTVQYQTDRVIIPTAHKSKSYNNRASSSTVLETETVDRPKFSFKTYSSSAAVNNFSGILGVEYVIKIMKHRNDVAPRYECGLCELVFDGFVMQRHLEGYNHRLKFCEKHFPTAIRQYRQYMHNVPEHEVFKVMTTVLAKLAVAIEQHHGRNLPYECYERDYSLNRHEILAKAFSCRHASEQYGPAFTNVVGSKEIDEFINNRHNYVPQPFSRTAIFDTKAGSIECHNRHQNSRNVEEEFNVRGRHRHTDPRNSLSDGTTYKSYMSTGLHEDMYPVTNTYQEADSRAGKYLDDETYNIMVEDFLKGTLKGLPKNSTCHEIGKRSASPDQNFSTGKRKSISPLRQNDIWQAYRHMVDQQLYSLNELYKQYRKDPETHPSYNEEWQKFWKRRRDELVSAGLDHHKYNYQPEWVRFVKIRIEELYDQEVEKLKLKSRERLCLPLTNNNIDDVKYHVQAPGVRDSSNDLSSTVRNIQAAPVSSASSSLLHSANKNIPQVVSVLRLMTALEDSLGSLGPKITEMLSKALHAEKNNPLHVNAIILTDDNCSLIETAKEKFKGLVITGLFEQSKKRVLDQVVNDADVLLQYAYQFKQQLASQRLSLVNRMQNNLFCSLGQAGDNSSSGLTSEVHQNDAFNSMIRKSQSSSTKTDNLLSLIDKRELASKLAASLVAQGKTDFDPQQLQQLIAVYKVIEKNKRENKSSKSFGGAKECASSSKKTLSNTLSDLLRSSVNPTDVTKISNSSNQGNTHSAYVLPDTYGNCIPSTSYRNNLQNYSGNYFYNTAQPMYNTFPANNGRGNHVEQQYNNMNYGMNLPSNQHNSIMSNMCNNQFQNNKMPRISK